jgi:hypothetical protein
VDSPLVMQAPLGRRDQAEIKQTRKTAATSDRQRTHKPLFHRHSRPTDTTHQTPDRLCKQEVTGSIPVGSIQNTCKSAGFGAIAKARAKQGRSRCLLLPTSYLVFAPVGLERVTVL